MYCRQSTIDPKLVVTTVSGVQQVGLGTYRNSGRGKLGIGGLVQVLILSTSASANQKVVSIAQH